MFSSTYFTNQILYYSTEFAQDQINYMNRLENQHSNSMSAPIHRNEFNGTERSVVTKLQKIRRRRKNRSKVDFKAYLKCQYCVSDVLVSRMPIHLWLQHNITPTNETFQMPALKQNQGEIDENAHAFNQQTGRDVTVPRPQTP